MDAHAPEGKVQCLSVSVSLSVCLLPALFISTLKIRYEQFITVFPQFTMKAFS